MKFEIKKEVLLKNLKLCNEIISNVNINPVLSGLLFDVKNDNIELLCSNNTISSKININDGISISSSGKFLIKCSLLFNIVNKISENNIVFDLIDDSIIKISTNKFTCNINLLDTTSYPLINFDVENWKKIEINTNFFNKINNKLLSTTLDDISQINILNGIYIESNNSNEIEAISTDSFHLTFIKDEYKGEQFKFVLSVEVIKLINDFNENSNNQIIQIYLNGNEVIFNINNNLVLTRCLEGNYPTLNKILNNKYNFSFTVNKKDLTDAINRGVLLIVNKTPTLQLNVKGDQLFINFRSLELGSSYEDLPIKEYKGEPVKIYLNSKYLLDLLKSIESTEVQFNFNSETQPIVLKDLKDNNFLSLILPIKGM